MAIYAIISGNTVSNMIVTDDKEQAEKDLGCTLIESTDDNAAYINGTYDESTGLFSPPLIADN